MQLWESRLWVLLEDMQGRYWQAQFDEEYLDTLSKKIAGRHSLRSLYVLGAKALGGDKGVLLDVLGKDEIRNIFLKAGTLEEGEKQSIDENDKVLVLIDNSTPEGGNIPLPLKLTATPDSNMLLLVIERLRKSKYNDNVLITGTDSQKEEIAALKKELERLRLDNERLAAGDTARLQREVQNAKKLLCEAEIENSVIPVIKKQLNEKNQEIEELYQYVREVEICAKIKAPVPTYDAYRNKVAGRNPDGGRAPPQQTRATAGAGVRGPRNLGYDSNKKSWMSKPRQGVATSNNKHYGNLVDIYTDKSKRTALGRSVSQGSLKPRGITKSSSTSKMPPFKPRGNPVGIAKYTFLKKGR